MTADLVLIDDVDEHTRRELRHARVEATLALMRAATAAPGMHRSPERVEYDTRVVAPLRAALVAAFAAEEAAP